MNENLNSESVDSRLIKGIVAGIIHDHIRTKLELLLAYSPGKLAKELQISDPITETVWILSGSFAVEDRRFYDETFPTKERETWGPLADRADLFSYPFQVDHGRSELTFRLPELEDVEVCWRCKGKLLVVKDCDYCKGRGWLKCDTCLGEKGWFISCPDCERTGIQKGHTDPDIYPCKRCKGKKGDHSGDLWHECEDCKTGFTLCPHCEAGKTQGPCDKCDNGFLFRQVELIIRPSTKPIEHEYLALIPQIPEDILSIGMMHHVYTTTETPISLNELKQLPNSSLPPQVWERVKYRLAELHNNILESHDGEWERRITDIKVSVYKAQVFHVLFQYKERSGNVWLVLGDKREPIRHSVVFFPSKFSDFVTELMAIILSFTVGASFSWLFNSLFPFLTVSLAGILIILAFRYWEWRPELTPNLIKILSVLVIFFSMLGGIVVFLQGIGSGTPDSLTIIVLIAITIMTTLNVAGINSEPMAKFLNDLIKTIFNK